MTTLDRTTFDDVAAGLSPGRSARMHAAFDIFAGLDMPSEKEEAWRYVSLDRDLRNLPLAGGGATPLPEGGFLRAVTDRDGTAVIVDGRSVRVESGQAELRAFRDLDDAESDDVAGFVSADRDIFAAARAAFGTDGVQVVIPSGTIVTSPVVIDVQAVQEAASFPYVDIRAGEDCEVDIILILRSAEGVGAVIAPQVGIRVGDRARVRYVAVQALDFAAVGVVHQRIEIGRDGSFKSGEIGLGGRLGRLDLDVVHEGNGSSSDVVGVYFGEYDQTLDYRMVLHHRGKNTSSNVFLKGAVEDDAQSVFIGLLKIERDATRTSAFETNRNLVLSENAKAHSVPNLEILCDDVVCGHASSVGQLEEDHLYYLQSRGISKERAERMLIRGFFTEIIDRLPVHGLDQPVADELFGRFVEAQIEGRL